MVAEIPARTTANPQRPLDSSGVEDQPCTSSTSADSNTDQQLRPENCELSLCFACGAPIHDRYLYKVHEQCYHEKCLCCSQCGEPFRNGKCYARDAQLFCREHFLHAFGPKCARCAAPIGERTIVRRANQHIYHLECFQCAVCKRELNTGDQFYLVPMDGRLVCRQDFENATKEGSDMDCGNKRPRTTISAKSLETLKQAYQCSSKPARHVREQLAAQTGLDMRVVQVWFQNRRAKEKRLKKDAGRRWAAQQHQHNASGGGSEHGSSNGSAAGATGASGSGAGMLFGRAGTLDSDSGASNEAESPLYAYTNPETSSDVDVHSMSEFYDPNNSFHQLQGSGQGQEHPQDALQHPPGTPALQQLSAMMAPLGTTQPQQSPKHSLHNTPPTPAQPPPQQQLFTTLESLSNGVAGPGTPMGGGMNGGIVGTSAGSGPSTPQHHHLHQQQQLFMHHAAGNEQYLLAAAAAGGFGGPPPMGPPPPQSQHFMLAAPSASGDFYAPHPASLMAPPMPMPMTHPQHYQPQGIIPQ